MPASGPGRRLCRKMPQLDVRKAMRARPLHRFGHQRPGGHLVVGDQAAIVHKGERNGERAKDPRPERDERQAAGHPAAATRDQIVRGVAECVAKHQAPSPLVIGRRIAMRRNLCIPFGRVLGGRDRHRRGVERRRGGLHPRDHAALLETGSSCRSSSTSPSGAKRSP